ncbi:diguanylate cyclase [Heliobacterium gestii]|uniref:Diguanylate cyclase n=1 Tax=Heliomicrobium gestii TaxID=2699 RepID=A0A845LCW9_HELGE|nr:HD domain-containing phosphohydrolase [Heliomicrobium gestii]MBM7868333.1 diguanylate cyclase (GGDEF)-like protein [Heliomicrobium gestii]MZP44512.1 diguanylate cyclase [Heliomicrobium gestii]
MGIGRKIALLHISLILTFALVIFLLGQQVWGGNYLKLERDEVTENAARSLAAWESELDRIGSQVEDWGPWDDTFDFARKPADPTYAEKNLSDAAMANLGVDAVIIADWDGRILFAKALDLEKKREVPLAPGWDEHVRRISSLEALVQGGKERVESFVMVGTTPTLVAAHPILTSKKAGPSPGVLIFARTADDAFLRALSKRTQADVRFLADPAKEPPPGGPFFQEIVDKDTVLGYAPLADLYGRQGYYLVSAVPRLITMQGQQQMGAFLVSVIAFGLFFVAMTLLILRGVLLPRLQRIDDFMNAVSAGEDLSIRLHLPGNDELSKIAATMNAMLERIEESNGRTLRLFQTVRRELEEREKAEEALRFFSLHDALTGTYNRAFFEAELGQVVEEKAGGIGIICCDVDGLKLVNDTLGHSVGDTLLIQTAQILQGVFQEKGIVARMGGDEFVVLLRNVDEGQMQRACQRIRESLEMVKPEIMGFRLSLSVGWKYSRRPPGDEETIRALMRDADDTMYRHKLSSSQSNRNALVQALMKMLEARDYITEGHSQRLQELVIRLGKAVGLPEERFNDLCLLAQFHDIGKVGIPDQILFKPGPLTPEERKEMERHAEIGHRIAQVVPGLLPVADLILKHHEWWNGKGYPLGLQGEEIPMEARILAITDAFDAMTNDRTYRKALSEEAAFAELRRCSGVQFDPQLVERFIAIVGENGEKAATA